MSNPLSEHSIIRAAENLIFRDDLGGEVALFNPASKQYYGLDAVGADIWRSLKQPRTLRQIRDIVLVKYEVAPECCERDLRMFMQELAAEGLVEISDESRREATATEPAA
jgi:hypothetical protein